MPLPLVNHLTEESEVRTRPCHLGMASSRLEEKGRAFGHGSSSMQITEGLTSAIESRRLLRFNKSRENTPYLFQLIDCFPGEVLAAV